MHQRFYTSPELSHWPIVVKTLGIVGLKNDTCAHIWQNMSKLSFVQSSMKTEKTFFCFILNIINHSAIVTICFAKFFISVYSNMRLYRTATFFCCCHYSDVFRCSFSKLQIHLMVKKKKDLWKFQAFIFFLDIHVQASPKGLMSKRGLKVGPENDFRWS